MIDMTQLNEKVISVLGEDHPVSKAIAADEEGLMIQDVLFHVMVALTDRIDALEARITGRGLN